MEAAIQQRESISRNTLNVLLLIGLVSHTMWLFGNIYEAIVDAPNLTVAPAAARQCWLDYHRLTNPIYYHIPNTPIGFLAVLLAWWRGRTALPKQARQWLKWAVISSLIAVLMTVYVVTTINLKLYFGGPNSNNAEVLAMANRWMILNGLRIVAELATVVLLFRVYLTFYSARYVHNRPN